MVTPTREVKGGMDMTMTSIGDNRGTTVEVTDNDNGEVESIYLPQEVDVDDIEERDQSIIEAAVQNPQCSVKSLADKTEWSYSVLQSTLSEEVPNWYENVFKRRGESAHSADYHGNKCLITDNEIIQLAEQNGAITSTILMDESGMERASALERLNSLADEDILEFDTGVDGFHPSTKVYTLADEDDSEVVESEEEIVIDVEEEGEANDEEEVSDEVVAEAVDEVNVEEVDREDTVEVPRDFVEGLQDIQRDRFEHREKLDRIEAVSDYALSLNEDNELASAVLSIVRE